MELYYIIGIALYFSLFLEFFIKSRKIKRYIIFLWMFFFILLGGLRWRIGNDWLQYYDHYIHSSWSNIFSYDRYGNKGELLEPGFVFTNVLIKSTFGSFYWYNIFICAFIQYASYEFTKVVSPRRHLFAYISLMILHPLLFPVRAGFSLGFIYFAYINLIKRDLKYFLLFVIGGSLIHYQCLVCLPIYFLGKIKLKYTYLVLLHVTFAFLGYMFQSTFRELSNLIGGDVGQKALLYTEKQTLNYIETYSGINVFGYILNFFFLSVFYYIGIKNRRLEDPAYIALLNASLLHISVFMIFSNGMGDLTRLSSIFYPAVFALLLYSFNTFMRTKPYSIKYLAICFLLAYYAYKLPGMWSGYYFKDLCVPYKTIYDYHIV